jgi:hypothetical protein
VLVSKEEHPVLHGLTVSFKEFKVKFLCDNKNFWNSNLCFNPLVTNTDGVPLINERWLNRNIPRIEIEEGLALKVSDVLNGWEIKRLDEIVDSTNIQLSLVSYMRLAEILTVTKNKWRRKINGIGTGTSLVSFFGRFKKGSKKFRKFLQDRGPDNAIMGLTVVKTFQRVSNVVINDSKTFKTLHGLWDNKGLSNQVREFAFKFFNNILGLNTRVSHFNNTRDRKCELCKRDKVTNPEDETFSHLFSRCKVAKIFKKGLIEHCFPEWGVLSDEKWDKFWLVGMEPNQNECLNLFVAIIALLGNYYIWELKIKKKKGVSGRYS